MMKIAVSAWNNRIAPVFDVARQLEVIEIEEHQIKEKMTITCTEGALVDRVKLLTELGVEALICGAISRALGELIVSKKIQVVSFVSGDVNKLLSAWIKGTFIQDRYAMPGCCRRRCHDHQSRLEFQEDQSEKATVSCGGYRRRVRRHNSLCERNKSG